VRVSIMAKSLILNWRSIALKNTIERAGNSNLPGFNHYSKYEMTEQV
jgi:hypothetical protein